MIQLIVAAAVLLATPLSKQEIIKADCRIMADHARHIRNDQSDLNRVLILLREHENEDWARRAVDNLEQETKLSKADLNRLEFAVTASCGSYADEPDQ